MWGMNRLRPRPLPFDFYLPLNFFVFCYYFPRKRMAKNRLRTDTPKSGKRKGRRRKQGEHGRNEMNRGQPFRAKKKKQEKKSTVDPPFIDLYQICSLSYFLNCARPRANCPSSLSRTRRDFIFHIPWPERKRRTGERASEREKGWT